MKMTWKIRTAFWLSTAALLVSGCAGCVTDHVVDDRPPVVSRSTLSWSGSFVAAGNRYWLSEARNKFDDPFVLSVHGASNQDPEKPWECVPDSPRPECEVDGLAWMLHDLMPDRDIVLITCNPKHLKVTAPRVWYYPGGNVWSHPGWACAKPPPKGVATKIADFVQGIPEQQ